MEIDDFSVTFITSLIVLINDLLMLRKTNETELERGDSITALNLISVHKDSWKTNEACRTSSTKYLQPLFTRTERCQKKR